jgi:hypothetical protein
MDDAHSYVETAAGVVPAGSDSIYIMSAREDDRGYSRALSGTVARFCEHAVHLVLKDYLGCLVIDELES